MSNVEPKNGWAIQSTHPLFNGPYEQVNNPRPCPSDYCGSISWATFLLNGSSLRLPMTSKIPHFKSIERRLTLEGVKDRLWMCLIQSRTVQRGLNSNFTKPAALIFPSSCLKSKPSAITTLPDHHVPSVLGYDNIFVGYWSKSCSFNNQASKYIFFAEHLHIALFSARRIKKTMRQRIPTVQNLNINFLFGAP